MEREPPNKCFPMYAQYKTPSLIRANTFKKAFKGVAWVSSARILSGIIGFLTNAFIIYSLEPSQYGIGSLVLSVGGLLSTFSELGFRHSIIKTIIDAKTTGSYSEARRLLIIAITISLSIGLLIATPVFLFSSKICRLLNSPEAADILKLGSILTVTIPLQAISLAAVSSLQEFKVLTIFTLLGSLTRLFTFIVTVETGAKGMVFSIIISQIAVTILSLIFSHRRLSSSATPEDHVKDNWIDTCKKLLSFSRYLLATNILKGVHTRLDVLLLSLLGDPTLLGYYKAASEISVPFLNLITSTSFTTLYPILSESHTLRDRETFKKLHQTFMKIELAIAMPLACGMIVLMRPFLSIFFPRYLPSVIYFQVLATRTPILVLYNLYNPTAILALSMPERRLQLSSIATVLKTTQMLILIPTFGLNGAVFTEIFVHLILLFLSYYTLREEPVAQIKLPYFLRLSIPCTIMSVLVYFLSRVYLSGIYSIPVGVIVGVVVFSVIFIRIGGLTPNEVRSVDRLFGSNPIARAMVRVVEKIKG